jgi:hypothetical protein
MTDRLVGAAVQGRFWRLCLPRRHLFVSNFTSRSSIDDVVSCHDAIRRPGLKLLHASRGGEGMALPLLAHADAFHARSRLFMMTWGISGLGLVNRQMFKTLSVRMCEVINAPYCGGCG